ncbi:MAG: hypothetical protein RLZZ370_877, partial [Bacteroidota bacterium]
YEFAAGMLLFAALWMLRKKPFAPGVLFGIYLIMAGVERWFVETIRVNTQYHFAGLEFSQAQLISVILIVAGSFGIWYLSRNRLPEKA